MYSKGNTTSNISYIRQYKPEFQAAAQVGEMQGIHIIRQDHILMFQVSSA
jgi:hypothetical protein